MTFGLAEAGLADLSIWDLTGRRANQIMTGEMSAGVHTVVWNAEGLPSGVYLARLESAGERRIRTLTLVK